MAATQLNLADRIAVRANIRDRCTAAVANFALYILGEDPGTVNHVNRLAWAREAVRSPASFGDSLSWYVINQPAYLDNGSGIDDPTLTGAVETAIGVHFIAP